MLRVLITRYGKAAETFYAGPAPYITAAMGYVTGVTVFTACHAKENRFRAGKLHQALESILFGGFTGAFTGFALPHSVPMIAAGSVGYFVAERCARSFCALHRSDDPRG